MESLKVNIKSKKDIRKDIKYTKSSMKTYGELKTDEWRDILRYAS